MHKWQILQILLIKMTTRLELLRNQMNIHQEINLLIADPKESLQHYRSKSTIDQKQYKQIFYGPNWEYRERLFNVVRNNQHIFKLHHYEEFSRDEQRYHSFLAMKNFYEKLQITYEQYEANPNIVTLTSVAMYSYDPAVCIKFGVHFHLYGKTIINLGTDKHRPFLERGKTLSDIGSFALTELGHGSNVRNVLTTAIFDPIKKAFILNTPTLLATKFWIGATANLANMTVVFAQLYIGSECHGVHAFLVEIRDKANHTVKPGITIGDCGPKNGLNGIDNGFLIFKDVEVPLDNLLDRFAQVNSEGKFTTTIEDPDKRFAVQLGSLSGGRIILSLYGAVAALNALAIGIRYAAVRKQFGLPGDQETSVLEYPLTQLRLMVPLATTLIYIIAGRSINQLWDSNQSVVFDPSQMAEVHAISSCLKGQTALFANKVILECRQMLGGHGYHQFNRLGIMINEQDINNTWEGDTNVLLQQTAKFLVDQVNKLMAGKPVKHSSVQFLCNKDTSSPFQKNTDLLSLPALKRALEIRCAHLVIQGAAELNTNLGSEPDMFAAWNKSLPFYLQKAIYAYADVYCMQEWCKIKTDDLLDKVFALWMLSIIEQDPLFREMNIITAEHAVLIRRNIMSYCGILKEQAIGIIDALAPPDEILGSVFGSSDGDIYNKYMQKIYSAKGTFERVPWWQEIHQQSDAPSDAGRDTKQK